MCSISLWLCPRQLNKKFHEIYLIGLFANYFQYSKGSFFNQAVIELKKKVSPEYIIMNILEEERE